MKRKYLLFSSGHKSLLIIFSFRLDYQIDLAHCSHLVQRTELSAHLKKKPFNLLRTGIGHMPFMVWPTALCLHVRP